MRELMLGPKRFSDIRADLPGISANVLTQRLEGLEAAGLVVRSKLPPPAFTPVYGLTAWGYEAEPIIQTLGRWAVRSPDHDPNQPISAVSLMLSFRTMIDAERIDGVDARIGFRLGNQSFLAHVVEGRIDVIRGPVDGADLIFTAPPAIIAAAVYGGQPLKALEAAGELAIEGDRALADRFVTWFPLPPKVEREA